MVKLRQIFVLKDLGFQLEEMKLIMNKEVSQEDFAILLTKHNDLLKKIERYEEIQNNISMVLKLLEDETYSIIFSLKDFDRRTFLMLDSQEILEDSPKGYYDRFREIIHEEYYNERVLVYCYSYNLLDSFESGFSKLCFIVGNLPNTHLRMTVHSPKSLKLGCTYQYFAFLDMERITDWVILKEK